MELLINIDVPDLAAGVAFYRDGVGFEFRRYLFDRLVAEMSLGAIRVFLLEQADGSIAVPGSKHSRAYDDHWTPIHLDIVVDDLEAATERAVAAGARMPEQTGERDWGRINVMRDPFGHGFCLIQFRGSDYDLGEV